MFAAMKSPALNLTPLFDWFNENKRDLPWRKNRTFYRVWVSEIMLQQTQVATVIPYYERFLARFPSADALAAAPLDDVLKLWEGLGYYSRARNLHKAAAELSARKELPTKYDDLIKVTGFGPYTTAAVLSFTYGAPHAVVDGNVKRVFARLFALTDDISTEATKKKIQALADALLPAENSAVFNESVMELGATVCLPKQANCRECPLQSQCLAFKKGNVASIPYRAKRKKVPTKKVFCHIWQNGNRVFITRRNEDEMLGGLWHFPRREARPEGAEIAVVKHVYSHFKLELTAILSLADTENMKESGEWVELSDLGNYAFDKASHKVIDALRSTLA